MENNTLLRVLHVQQSLAAGGMENGVVNVANMLSSQGFEFHVACLTQRGDFADRMPDPDSVATLSKPEGFSPRTVFRLSRLVSKVRPHVVHSHNLGALIYSALATGWGRTRPILHGEHGTPDDGENARRRRSQRRFFYSAATAVHTVSHSLRDHLISQGFHHDTIVPLVNGVDTSRFSPGDKKSARESLGIVSRDPVVVVVGRLIESKRHQLLFEAFEEVVGRWNQAVLLVVGSGGAHENAVVRAARDSSISANIHMVGYCSDPLPYYRASDLLVSPSSVEGLSNVVLEAMATGTAPLVHDACGNREIIQHTKTGIVTDLSTRESLGNQLVSTLNDLQACIAMGQRARASVERDFSLQRMAEGYADIYRKISRGESVGSGMQ